MASIYDLKPRFQALLRPLTNALAKAGVSANQVTLAATLISLVWGGLLAWTHGAAWTLIGLPFILILRMGLNAIDGMLAREHGQATNLGAILNELGDVVSDTALYLPFALILGPLWILPVVLLPLTELSGILPQTFGGGRRYDGPMGKSDRAMVYGVLAVILVFIPLPPIVSITLVGLISFLTLVTVCNRILRGLDV